MRDVPEVSIKTQTVVASVTRFPRLPHFPCNAWLVPSQKSPVAPPRDGETNHQDAQAEASAPGPYAYRRQARDFLPDEVRKASSRSLRHRKKDPFSPYGSFDHFRSPREEFITWLSTPSSRPAPTRPSCRSTAGFLPTNRSAPRLTTNSYRHWSPTSGSYAYLPSACGLVV